MSQCLTEDCIFLDGHDGEHVLVHDIPQRVTWADLPADPWHEMATGLWQGGSFATPRREDFDAVLTLYRDAPPVEDGIKHVQWIIPDGPMADPDEFHSRVDWVSGQWRAGKRVLVRCQAGLNRSGLVVAQVLIDAGGNPDEVIRHLRTRRSKFVLCNSNFEAYLRSQHV